MRKTLKTLGALVLLLAPFMYACLTNPGHDSVDHRDYLVDRITERLAILDDENASTKAKRKGGRELYQYVQHAWEDGWGRGLEELVRERYERYDTPRLIYTMRKMPVERRLEFEREFEG